jgi:hypothetical protein
MEKMSNMRILKNIKGIEIPIPWRKKLKGIDINQTFNIIIEPKNKKFDDQDYFYTPEWQAGEREADEDIQEGNMSEPVDNIPDLMKYLDGLKK